MSSLAAPTSPTVTRTGDVRASRTSFSTFVGIVAENNSVCRSGLTWPMIDRTCRVLGLGFWVLEGFKPLSLLLPVGAAGK